ncbi:MAG: CocE/NonD family hydrolase [Pseudomonadota bacterium]|nr:CocE/NonD family hydrolase [Pseudomonadota bacterium]
MVIQQDLEMIIERDLPIKMDDGNVLRADVYRPKTRKKVPVVLAGGPYGKGVKYQEHYKPLWDSLLKMHPDLLSGSKHRWLTWETVDPEIWVPWGYACVRVDSRGAGRSPGYLDIFSPQETKDFAEAIEWAGVQRWSNGKVGLNGVSYYAINQWQVAALQPKHLTAMIPWEGAADHYRDWARHGGILSNKFMEIWYPRQVEAVQHGNPKGPRDHWQKTRATGPSTYSRIDLASKRADTLENFRIREMDDDWYRSRSPDWSKVRVPFLSAASWAGFGLHPRGNFEAFTQAASKQNWLEGHPGRHEEWFYLEYGMELQKRFFDYYLLDKKNGWNKEPRVQLNLRRPFTNTVELRKESEWPLKGTKWTKLYLNAGGKGKLEWKPSKVNRKKTFRALTRGVTWMSPPLDKETEITGPMAAKLYVSSTTNDCDLFVTVQAFAPNGREVYFQGTVDPKTPVAQGWLRVSHRKLDKSLSKPWRPYHSHDDKQPLIPNEIYEVEVEIWPQCIVLPKGFRVALNVAGQDFDRRGPSVEAYVPSRGSGPFLHDHPQDRPKEIFGGATTLYSGPRYSSYILLPIIPKNRRSK